MSKTCDTCGGHVSYLGALATTAWGRCQDCGWLQPLGDAEDYQDQEDEDHDDCDD